MLEYAVFIMIVSIVNICYLKAIEMTHEKKEDISVKVIIMSVLMASITSCVIYHGVMKALAPYIK